MDIPFLKSKAQKEDDKLKEQDAISSDLDNFEAASRISHPNPEDIFAYQRDYITPDANTDLGLKRQTKDMVVANYKEWELVLTRRIVSFCSDLEDLGVELGLKEKNNISSKNFSELFSTLSNTSRGRDGFQARLNVTREVKLDRGKKEGGLKWF